LAYLDNTICATQTLYPDLLLLNAFWQKAMLPQNGIFDFYFGKFNTIIIPGGYLWDKELTLNDH